MTIKIGAGARLLTTTASTALLFGFLIPGFAEANPVSDIVVFGDSSSDLGSQGPERRPTNQGQMWSERLAAAIGQQSKNALEFRINTTRDGIDVISKGGNSFAVNGATALPYDCCITLEQQVDFFVGDRGRFKGDELVFIWLTRNDITTAIPEGLPYSAETYASAYLAQVERMRSLGAGNIVAFGAETGLLAEQFGLDNGASPQALELLREETRLAESALWPGLVSNDVFIIDINKLGNDVLANPAKYGFLNTTDSYQLREQYLAGGGVPIDDQNQPNDGNVFTVDGHYTTAMQAVVADYTLAQLRGREQFSSLLHQTALGFRQSRQAASSLRMNESGKGWSVFAAPIAGRLDQNSSGSFDVALNETFAGVTLGAERKIGDGFRLGSALTFDRRDASFESNLGAVESTHGLATGFIEMRLAPSISLVADGAIGFADFGQIERRATLGSTAAERAEGSTDGKTYAAGLRLKSSVPVSEWIISGDAGLAFERTEIGGYSERDGVLALHYGTSRLDANLAQINLHVTRATPATRFQPFGSLSVTYDFADDPIEVEVGPTADTIVTYATDRNQETAIRAAIGFDVRISESIALRTSLTHQSWLADRGDASSNTLQFAFFRSF